MKGHGAEKQEHVCRQLSVVMKKLKHLHISGCTGCAHEG